VRIGEAFPSNYLKAVDLQGRAVKVVIDSVSTEKIGDDSKPVLHFVGKDKALVLNKTNANRIVELTGSDETNNWEGWTITLYGTKVDFQGQRVDAIRVDDRPGAATPPAGKRTAEAEPIDASDVPF
jgi:hypothetical protein